MDGWMGIRTDGRIGGGRLDEMRAELCAAEVELADLGGWVEDESVKGRRYLMVGGWVGA